MENKDTTYDWELYTQLISFMNEAVWVWDKDEKTVYANPKFCEIMEYSLEEMIWRESYEFWDTVSAETVRKHVYNIYNKLHVSNRVEAVNKFFGR